MGARIATGADIPKFTVLASKASTIVVISVKALEATAAIPAFRNTLSVNPAQAENHCPGEADDQQSWHRSIQHVI